MLTKNQKILLASVLVVALIIASFLLYRQFKNKPSQNQQETANLSPAPEYTKTDLSTDSLPEIFPKDIILEKNAPLWESYEADLGDGKKQYSIKFASPKNPREIFLFYVDYLAKNQWALVSGNKVVEDNTRAYVSAAKPEAGRRIYIDASTSEVIGESMVNIIVITHQITNPNQDEK